jgi:hypothetical protein
MKFPPFGLLIDCLQYGANLEFQLTGKYDENRSIREIFRVKDILSLDRRVTVQFSYLATTTQILSKIVTSCF